MIKDLSSRSDPLATIQKLIKERYVDAKAVFWAGSVSEDLGTSASDLDLVIVFEKVAHAYREAFIYDAWPIDAFIHDIDTLRYFFEIMFFFVKCKLSFGYLVDHCSKSSKIDHNSK